MKKKEKVYHKCTCPKIVIVGFSGQEVTVCYDKFSDLDCHLKV